MVVKKTKPKKKAAGRPKIEIDLEKVERLAMTCDSKADIARILGISLSTIERRQRDLEGFDDAIKRGQSKAMSFVTSKLMKAIEGGNITALIFWLKCHGWREINRTELTGADGNAIEAVVKNEGVDGWEQMFQKLKAPKKS